MRRAAALGVVLAAVAAGCRCGADAPRPAKPAGPPQIDTLGEAQAASLFNGTDLTGWNVLSDDIYYNSTGKVVVADGAVVLGAGQELTGVQWAGKMLRDEFRITLQARRIEGGDFFCGLTFPVRKGYVSLILGGWGGSAVGLSDIDDSSAIENETTQAVDFVQGKWYDVEVEVSGGRIVVALDDEVIIEHKIDGHRFDVWPQQEPARPLGVTTYCTKGAFRKFVVKRLAGD